MKLYFRYSWCSIYIGTKQTAPIMHTRHQDAFAISFDRISSRSFNYIFTSKQNTKFIKETYVPFRPLAIYKIDTKGTQIRSLRRSNTNRAFSYYQTKLNLNINTINLRCVCVWELWTTHRLWLICILHRDKIRLDKINAKQRTMSIDASAQTTS